ncbi:MAG: hypothetical protein AAB758_00820 [Patescibacteria group bacterium]
MNRYIKRNRGASLVETLVYVFIFTALTLALINAIHSLTFSYRFLQSSWNIEEAAQISLERMVREVRNSVSVNDAESILNFSPGILTLNSKDENNNEKTVQFLVSDGVIRVRENGVDTGPLSTSKANVTNLSFIPFVSGNSEALRIELTIESGQAENYKSKNFYTTVVLRNSYAQ